MNTTTTGALRPVTFNFKTLPATHKNFARDKQAMIEAGIPFDSVIEKIEGQDTETGIKRQALTLELPVYTVADFRPDWVQDQIDALVTAAARKGVDKFLPFNPVEFTPEHIMSVLESSDAGSGLSKELVKEAADFVRQVLAANGVGKAQSDIMCGLMEHKFSSKAIKANILVESKIPQMFATIGNIYSKAPPELVAKHTPVLEACAANHEKYLAEKASAADLEFAF